MSDRFCFIDALLKRPVSRTPVWFMRQAGRYLPEYRQIRQQAGSFMNLCTNPELACEVTMQPLRRFRLDAAILFSDILTIPEAMGLGLSFKEGEGPCFQHPLRSEADIEQLPRIDPESDLRYVMDAVRLIRHELDGKVPLIGFAGSPWTLATYMVEGGSTRDFKRVKTLLYDRPGLMTRLMDKLSDAVADYLNAQIAAGAQAVMLFDTWGGVLTPVDYQNFALKAAHKVRQRLNTGEGSERIPTILFTKGGGQWLEAQSQAEFDALGLDWTCDIGQARQRVGGQVALQGNLDPITLYASASTIRERVADVLNSYGKGTGHVFNLGHGILPDVNPANVETMVEAVHELSPAWHQ